MHAFAFALLAHSALPLQADMEGAPMEPPVFCDATGVAEPDTVAEILTTPASGRWWLARANEDGTECITGSGPFTVVDGGGQVIAADDVHLTPAALSLAVPSGVGPGAVLQLLENGRPVSGVLLRVATGDAEGDPAAFSVDAVDVEGTVPEACEIQCRFEGMTVPAAPLLRLRYKGGPVILDAWSVMEGQPTDDLTPRAVDSRLLAANDDPTLETELRLSEVGFTAGLDVRVRALDPDSLEVLYDEVRVVAPLGEVSAEAVADVPLCDDRGFGPSPPFGCSAGTTPRESSLLLSLLLLFGALRRRRDRSA